jgi:hypothetical protein
LRKRFSIISFISIVSLLLISRATTVNAYNVELNDGFDFEILKCENTFYLDDAYGYGQGFEIDGQHFDQGTTVNFNITGFPLFSVQYNISSGGYSEISSNNLFGDLIDHYVYLLYPQTFLNVYYNTSDWEDMDLVGDPGYEFIPFINNASFTWDSMVNLVVDANNQSYLSSWETALMSTNGTYTNTTSEFYLEFYLHGPLRQNVTDSGHIFLMELDVEHHYQFAYNKTDNSMLGFRLMGELDGDSNGTIMEISYDYHTELVGYDLPDLVFGIPTGTPTTTPNGIGMDNLGLILGLGIGIPAVVILTTVIVLILIRKKRSTE